MSRETRVIKLPPRSMFRNSQTEPMFDMFAELSNVAAKLDPDLAQIIRAWPNLSPDLKNGLLALVSVPK